MDNYIYIITNVEMGWDCVCGAYFSKESVLDYFSEIYSDGELEGMTFDEVFEYVEGGPWVIHLTRLQD